MFQYQPELSSHLSHLFTNLIYGRVVCSLHYQGVSPIVRLPSAPSLIVARDFLKLLRDLYICEIPIRTTQQSIKQCLIIIILPPIELLFKLHIINAVV